jgi:hypothetical protein
MRLFSILALVSLTAYADHRGRFERFCSRTANGRTNRGFLCADDSPAFSAFASNGTGVPSSCSTSTITGGNGETFTGSRASSATCSTLGVANTGITPGTFSTLTTNQMRVEPDADGVRGLRIESQRTNYVIRSEELDDPAWISITSAGAVTVTPNAALSPFNTLTADRMQWSACPTLGQSSLLGQSFAGVTTNGAAYCFVRGNATSGSFAEILGMGSYSSSTGSYVAASYSRLPVSDVRASITELYVGCTNIAVASPNPGNTGAGDAFPWGCQTEMALFPTSYIPTASSQVTRAADVASFPVTLAGSTFSAAMNFTPLGFATGATPFEIRIDANNLVRASVTASNTLQCDFIIGGVTSTVTSVATMTAGVSNRVSCRYDGTGRQACVGGVCATTAGALTMPTGAATFWWGTRSTTGNEANGILSRGCYDQLSARCG